MTKKKQQHIWAHNITRTHHLHKQSVHNTDVQKMLSPQVVLKEVHKFLKGTAVFSLSFPLSILLIGLEKLTEIELFSCPCVVELNALLTASVFIGPALFILTLMLILLRPCKQECSRCCAGVYDDTQQNCPKAFAACLIPPVIWIFLLFLDGDYFACGMTDWKGVYVYDQELNRPWCKPTEKTQNETVLRDLTRKYIHKSQHAGYVWITVFSVLVIAVVGIYDCYISGKCKWRPRGLSCFCGQTMETQSEQQDSGADSLSLNAVQSTIQNQAVVPPSQEDAQNL
ncbi:calcium homeostasis modulator protein 5-like [Carassius auratus]|uniref:Calcium homeostasis modulator protein 5-like n=1 Tax=Carassius auratus TaxID=7957 RepID=A0A6P6J2B6_CARAU|nr:calcium homeostasis modulator protein 5-like [Carassius auratus]